MIDGLWAKLAEAQALMAGLEAENRILKLEVRRYLQNWTEARRERDELLREREAKRG